MSLEKAIKYGKEHRNNESYYRNNHIHKDYNNSAAKQNAEHRNRKEKYIE